MLTEFRGFLTDEKIYSPSEIINVLDMIRPYFELVQNKKVKYINVPCSFDIETTSFYRTSENGEQEKVAIMYEWTFGIFGVIIIGRTWSEFLKMIKIMINVLDVNLNKRLCIYVHNLAYEFQFMRKWFKWSKVFSIENRKPIYAITNQGIEFRCSYLLSGYSLERLADNLHKFTLEKLVGSLDYSLLRHSKTHLTEQEIAYCVNDVKIVMAYIAEQIENDGDITKIPLTKTGYVRNYCRNSCFFETDKPRKKSFKRIRYMEIMKNLHLDTTEYLQLKNAFQGGFTHANPFYSGKIVENVTSFDFTSSYPSVMVAEMFPMSASESIIIENREQLDKNLKLYCCLFDIEFTNLQSKLWFESYISISRCRETKNVIINNGRVVSAEHLVTTLTEQDFKIIQKFYTWDKIRIANFRRYKKDYLPTDFIKAILKLYQDKTQLKGVDGMEIEYLKSKEMLNSCYGMAVTDIVRDEIVYDEDEWKEPKKPEYEKAVEKYNNNAGRFLFYPWGVWVTAYARRNLFSGILEFGNDYIYSDTDSIKVKNAKQHQEYIEKYNAMMRMQLLRAMAHHKINADAIEPETKDGFKKCLGVWDFDGDYSRFKTLGAKRYIVEYSNDERNKKKDFGKINITVAGLNKNTCVPWMFEKWGKDGIFENFKNDLYVPAEHTGKMIHTYIDDIRKGTLIDYMGVPCKYMELSAVHLDGADYSLSISREYAEYIRGIQDN